MSKIYKARVKADCELIVNIRKFANGDIEIDEVLEVLDVDDFEVKEKL